MIKKTAYSLVDSEIDGGSVYADPKLIERINKFAAEIRSVAPKSDDFLYFSIIFLKSAESSTINDDGTIKVIAGNGTSKDKAWGYFDKKWKWHGNVTPHRNNNGDIFPEAELKKAAKDWIGMPSCRDHESNSVDGIRGIILDTHYDEKLKQVVGLCALDRINYPDLARKVETGLVRYGSMGTAVELSICTECGNNATTLDEYCEHVSSRTAYGEINVGLKPIEYSLVVQPAEPGARLLGCIASLNKYRNEFINYGVDDFDGMVGSLDESQAIHLNNIMKAACSDGSCSIPQRRKIVANFLKENNLTKSAYSRETTPEEAIGMAKAMSQIESATGMTYDNAVERKDDPQNQVAIEAYNLFQNIIDAFKSSATDTSVDVPTDMPPGEASLDVGVDSEGQGFLSIEDTEGPFGDSFTDSSATAAGGESISSETPALSTGTEGGTATSAGVSVPWEDRGGDVFDAGGVLPDRSVRSATDASNKESKTIIQSLMEDIMNESRLRKRAELRRRVAYHQGGADGVEPNTYKSEDWNRDQDKHMQQDGNMGGADGTFPGDMETKEKLSRAELAQRRINRMAYHQGGSDGVEPSTYKSVDWNRDQDKHMQQTGNMGGDKGTFPGDMQTKEKLSRAAYNGPALKTRFSQRKNLDGTINKAASRFQVFAGDDSVIDVTADDIFGSELEQNWEWLNSREYGKAVAEQIRESGLSYVSNLLKSAQDAAGGFGPPPPAPAGGADAGMPPAPPVGLEPPGGDLGELGPEEESAEEAEDPKELAEQALLNIETEVENLRGLVSDLGLGGDGGDVNINVDVEEDGDAGLEEEGDLGGVALARNIAKNVKTVFAELTDSADELALIVETYDNAKNLSGHQRGELGRLTRAAIRDSYQLCGESAALTKVAKSINVKPFVRTAEFAEGDSNEQAVAVATPVDVTPPSDVVSDVGADSLVAEAMELRRKRRESVLRTAENKVLAGRRKNREDLAKRAMEGYGDMENAADDAENAASDMENAADDAENAASDMENAADDAENAASDASLESSASYVKDTINEAMREKQVDDDKDAYRLKLRRAYDLGMEMQRKGLVATTKPALDRQVDEIMLFDDRAFEAFKRSIAHAKPVRKVSVASDLGGINVGVEEPVSSGSTSALEALASMWE